MTTQSYLSEGSSSNRPPLFEGKDFGYWKVKMEVFLKSQDAFMWDIIQNGDFNPTKVAEDGSTDRKPIIEMTSDERHRYTLNSKAKLLLICALGKTQFDKVSDCDTAREMWNILVVAYEGTRKVKLARSAMLTIQFETFQMKEGESIEELFSRLIIITNELKTLGTLITKLKKVQKLLGSLPDQWNAKVSAIEESKDLEELELDELMGILMVHEQKLEGRALLKKNSKSVAFKTATEQ